MITLCLILIIAAIIAGMLLFAGTAFIAIFGDFIVAFLVIYGIVKLVQWIRRKKK